MVGRFLEERGAGAPFCFFSQEFGFSILPSIALLRSLFGCPIGQLYLPFQALNV
jgi:hypothetical protein